MNVRRQRHLAPVLEELERCFRQAYPPEILAPLENLDFTAGGLNEQSRPDRLARRELDERALLRERPLEEYLDATSGRLAAEDARRNHPGVVEHEEVAGPKQFRQLSNRGVAYACRVASAWDGACIEHQQT